MTDKTSDDYLNQEEPVVEDDPGPPVAFRDEGIQDDPSLDEAAVAGMRAFFAVEQDAANTGAEAEPRAQSEVPTIADFIGDQSENSNSSTSALQAELAEVKRQLVLLRMTPQERYPEVLKDAEITLEEARAIMDRVLVQLEPWDETVVLNSFLSVSFQTRGQFDVRRMDTWAEKVKPQLDTTVKAEGLMNSMSASLIAYNDRRFDVVDGNHEEKWKATYEFLVSLPYPAFRLIQVALAAFDNKINKVFSDGFLENF